MPQGSRHFSLLVSFGPSFARTRLSSTPSISHFLLSLLIVFALSLSFFLIFVIFLVPSDSLHRLAGSSVFVQVYIFISLAPRSYPAVHLPRSYGSFVFLVISSYGRLCIFLRFSSRLLLAQVCLSTLSQILWKVSVLFVLALWAVSFCPCHSLPAFARFFSLPLAPAISGQTQAGLGYTYAKGPVWVGLYQFLRNNRTIAAVQLRPKLRFEKTGEPS